ncbi:MAG: phenylacetate--CoA ligase family protein, partial [Eubacteriales bacterium]|nr:phenylacetate--CoA ligase family protein [Eubacteriales bacterium]
MDITGSFIRNILFPIMEKVKGNKIRKYLSELRSHQDYSAKQLNLLQQDKLRVLLLHCIKNVPAYRTLASLENKINEDPAAALREFPVLSREIFRENSEKYISDNADRNALVANLTGGSTGAPVKFFHDRKTVEYYEAARWRGLSWHNIKAGDRCVMIWGAPKELSLQKSVKNRLKERFLKNRIIISAFSLDPASIRQYVDRIRKFRP